MKSNPLPRSGTLRRISAAFTLLELLVVLTIIGILASLVMPAGNQVTLAMRKMQATKMATELRTAIMNYYSEYKRFPPLTTGAGVEEHFGDTKVTTTGESGLIAALLSVPEDQTAQKLNPRGISFMSSTTAKQKGQAGVWKEGDGYELYDPWGNYYFILFDSNMDNAIKAPSKVDGTFGDSVIAEVAVWSYGPDKEEGKGSKSKKNDDIYAY